MTGQRREKGRSLVICGSVPKAICSRGSKLVQRVPLAELIPLSADHADLRLTRPGLRLDDYLHVLVERRQERHQALHRETVELLAGERRDLRLADAEFLGGGGLAQALPRDQAVDRMGEPQPRLPYVSVRIAEVGKHVAGASRDRLLHLARHLGPPTHPGSRRAEAQQASRNA